MCSPVRSILCISFSLGIYSTTIGSYSGFIFRLRTARPRLKAFLLYSVSMCAIYIFVQRFIHSLMVTSLGQGSQSHIKKEAYIWNIHLSSKKYTTPTKIDHIQIIETEPSIPVQLFFVFKFYFEFFWWLYFFSLFLSLSLFWKSQKVSQPDSHLISNACLIA